MVTVSDVDADVSAGTQPLPPVLSTKSTIAVSLCSLLCSRTTKKGSQCKGREDQENHG
jgi:hypothetical protein